MRYIFFFAAALAVSCSNPKLSQTEAGSDSLEYHYDSVKVYAKNPVSPDTNFRDTAKATIIYPLFQDKVINELVERRIAATIDVDRQYQGYKDIVQSFIAEFELDKKKYPDQRFMWFMQMDQKVVTNSKNIISVLNTYFSYRGGAHPNTVYISYNIKPETASFLSIDSLLKPGARPALDSLAESIFRKNEKLAPGQSLEGDYFFENDKFALPQTFNVTKSGLKFTYSPYEIKAYAAGKTELLIPFSELGAIVKEEYTAAE